MRDRIEHARQQFNIAPEDLKQYHMTEQVREVLPGETADHSTVSTMSAEADDELSSSNGTSGAMLSPPNSPLLPLFGSTAKTGIDRRLLTIAQPVSVVLFATAIFTLAGSSQSILNRFNMYQATFKFPYPYTLLMLQLLLAVILTAVLALVTRFWNFRVVNTATPIVPDAVMMTFTINQAIVRDHIFISVTFLVANASAMACLEYVPVHYFMLFTVPMLPLQLHLTKHFSQKADQTWAMAMSCLVLLSGYALIASSFGPVQGTPGFNYQGLLAGMICSFTLPLHNSLASQALSLNHKPVQLMWIVAVTSVLMLLPIIFFSGEFSDIARNCYFLDERGFWSMVLVVSLATTLATVSAFTLLSYVTPLTLVVLYMGRAALIMAPSSARLTRKTFNLLSDLGWITSLTGLLIYLFLINRHRPSLGLRWQ